MEFLGSYSSSRPTALSGRAARRALSLLTAALVLSIATLSSADSASWVSVGGGASKVNQDGLALDAGGLIQVEAGLGSDPHGFLVFGGLMKSLSHFGGGTDLILSERTTTSGFSLGRWGLALDLGGYARFWRDNSTGFAGALVAGAPWGVNVALQGQVGTENSTLLGLTLSFDWARFTAHRASGTSWWPNYRLPLERAEDHAGL